MEQLNFNEAFTALEGGARITREGWEPYFCVKTDEDVQKVNAQTELGESYEFTPEDELAEDWQILPATFFEDQNPSIGLEDEGGKKN